MTYGEYALTSEDRDSLEKILNLIGTTNAKNPYCTPYNVLRWIQAYGNDLELAAKKLKRHLVVRKIRKLDLVVSSKESPESLPTIRQSPITVLGKNRSNDNKIVVFELAGRVDFKSLVESVQLTPLLNSRFHLAERILCLMNEQEKISKRQSSAIFVVDLEGLQMSTNLISFLKGPFRIIWGTLLEQYPGLFSQIIVINVPNYINILWTACTPFITSSYRKKILITSSDHWRNELLQYVDACILPVHYGGKVLDETGDERCRLMIPFPEKGLPLPELSLPFPLDTFQIEPGEKLVHVYRISENSTIEFFMKHDENLLFGIFYAPNNIDRESYDEEALEEVYESTERPGLPTTDHWFWTTPHPGYYFVRYGHDAWFMAITVQQLLINISIDENTQVKIVPRRMFTLT